MSADLLASQLVCCQVLWELLTHEVPFRGLEGLAVAWLVVGRGVVSGAHTGVVPHWDWMQHTVWSGVMCVLCAWCVLKWCISGSTL